MILTYLNKVKCKSDKYDYLLNYKLLSLIIIYFYLIASIGQYIGTHNLQKLFLSENFKIIDLNILFEINGFIHIFIFFSLFLNLIFLSIKKRYIPLISFLLIYPFASTIGFLNNPDQERIDLLFHYFFSISNLILFYSIINLLKNKNQLNRLCLKIFLIFLIAFLLLFIIPDIFQRIYNNIHVRNIYFVNTNLFFFDYTFIQNSNGAGRVALIIFFIIFLKFYCNFDKKKKFKKYIFLSFIFSMIIFYYQSRFTITYLTIFLIIFIYFDKKFSLVKKLSILFFLIIIPFYSNNIYINYTPQINSSNDSVSLLNENLDKNLFKLNNNRIFQIDKKELILPSVIKDDVCPLVLNNDLFNRLDRFLSGRVCGWEIIILNIKKEDIFFGKGFFYDKKFLKIYQKIISNSYLSIFYNSGAIGFLSVIIIFLFFLKNYKKLSLLFDYKNNYIFLTSNIIIFLLCRGFFEDTLTFNGIDLFLFLNCLGLLSLEKNKKNDYQKNN